MSAIPLHTACASDVGLVRKTNEDYLFVMAEQGIVALADGMGGHLAGEVAAEVAVEELRHAQRFGNMDTMQCLMHLGEAVERANQSVYTLAKSKPELDGMGTTLVLALFHEDRIFYAHVGDSCLYLLRNDRLMQLTRDHSLIQEVLDHGIFPNRGEAKEAGVGENVLTRSLGFTVEINVDVNEAAVCRDDLFLFCSDGLTGPLKESQIQQLMSREELSLESRAKVLVQAAMDAGGRDNISVVLARPMLGTPE
ncbi:protein phosphatase 2C domain-containing protein [Thiolapillus sp.]|uniref:protein phosphatase 2C domain-containing protein n=1 Tax=Thiolapillus sp. TaxID=2017437 RepID=UPI003AF76359